MRYSLLAVAVSCTLMLTACNKSTDTAEQLLILAVAL